MDVGAVDGIVGRSEHKAAARRVAREAVTVLRREGMPLDRSKGLLVIAAAEWGDLGPPQPNANELFVEQVRKRQPGAEAVLVEDKKDTWQSALTAARNADSVILAVSSRIRSYTADSQRINGEIVDQAHKIAALGKHVSLVVMDNPYVVKSFPDTPVCLCTYSNCPDSATAAVEVLFGEFKPVGRLPVTISDRYKYGFGLVG